MKDHDKALTALRADQSATEDQNEQITKEIQFITLPDGQWEPEVVSQWGTDRPRYTFDITSANISKAWAEMAANEYSATTSPVGNGANKAVSKIIDGILREARNRSSFDSISTAAGKRMIAVGEAAWRIGTEYIKGTFNQRFKYMPLYDSHERVWWDSHSTMRTREDARWCFILSYVSDDEANRRWPDRDGDFDSLTNSRKRDPGLDKAENRYLVGEMIYKERSLAVIYQMSDGSVKTEEELKGEGINPKSQLVINSRQEDEFKVFSRHFDGKDWLDKEAAELPFKHIPVVSIYAYFDVMDGKPLYRGMVRPIMDHARVFNYVQSRKIEDSVLGLPDTIHWDSRTLDAPGLAEDVANINRSPKRSYTYKGVDGVTPPIRMPGSQPSSALSELSMDMINSVQLTTGLPNTLSEMQASKADSDFRSDQRQNIGQMGTYEYYKGLAVGLEYSAKVIVGAIPTVIDTNQIVTTITESGSVSEEEVNKNDNGEFINDLTRGDYSVTIDVGDTFKNRQTEANTKALEIAQYYPEVIQNNADLMINNIDAPGMQEMAERERAIRMRNGVIPEDQWTDEEREQAMIAAQQPQQPDPAQQIAQAELEKAQNLALKAQYDALGKQAELELRQQDQQTKAQFQAIELRLKEQAQQLDEQNAYFDNLLKVSQSIENLDNSGKTIDNVRQTVTEGDT